jgi:hypothetical protein
MIITTLDYVVEELKRNNNTKIDSYDLLSGFVAQLQQVENIRNPNTIRHFVVTAEISWSITIQRLALANSN